MSAVIDLLYGLIFGITTIIPGFSGATVAVICGFYNKLIDSVSGIFKNFKANVKFLVLFLIGAAAGAVASAIAVNKLIALSETVVNCVFLGIVVGTIPSVYKKSGFKLKTARLKEWLAFLIAGGALTAIELTNAQGAITFGTDSFSGVFNLFWVGFVAAFGPVVPGISGSTLLVIITGIKGYQTIIGAVASLDILLLLPFGAGAVLGIIVLSKLIKLCFRKFPSVTNAAILGLVVFSVIPLWHPLAKNAESLLAAVAAVAACLLSFFLVRFADKKQELKKMETLKTEAETESVDIKNE